MGEIVVDKSQRTLSLMGDDAVVATFPVLVGRNPGPKLREGDGCTPEGHYFVLRLLPDEDAVGKGYYKGLHLSYPSVSDADQALSDGRIDEATHHAIVSAYKEGTLPPQESPLGGYVAIHGGLAPDEPFHRGTQGCIVLGNADMDEVYAFAHKGLPVTIHP